MYSVGFSQISTGAARNRSARLAGRGGAARGRAVGPGEACPGRDGWYHQPMSCAADPLRFSTIDALPHRGLCPPSERECPPCAAVRCSSGGCAEAAGLCAPNIYLKGKCDATHCEDVEWCHVLTDADYACWSTGDEREREPGALSAATALLRFSDLEATECNYCTSIRSRYPCGACCGTRATALWSGSHTTNVAAMRGGGILMEVRLPPVILRIWQPPVFPPVFPPMFPPMFAHMSLTPHMSHTPLATPPLVFIHQSFSAAMVFSVSSV